MDPLPNAARKFLPGEFAVEDRAVLEPFFLRLSERAIDDPVALEAWLRDLSEVEAAIEEEGAWRYIRMTCDTRDPQASGRYQDFVSSVMPMVEEWKDRLDRKFMASPAVERLTGDGYAVLLRGIREQLRIFREENVPIQAELRALAQDYSATIGAMTIDWKGETITLPKAAAVLEGTDRSEREAVYRAMAARRAQDADTLEGIFDRMLAKRHTMACNAGFANYRDHSYSALGRFDHRPADAFAFHDAIERTVVPVVEELERDRRHRLGVGTLRPWDLAVDRTGAAPLRPFTDPEELVALTVSVFDRLDPYFADCIRRQQAMGRLDLGSREGKAPGGYNYPLYESGAPFIFMNAVGTHDDVITMMHEGGHAVHSFLTHGLPLTGFKSFPSEVAELASMSMELLTMDHWHLIYPDPEELRRAKRDQLERVIGILPWVATIDAFQHWLYENPGHTREERTAAWLRTHARFSGNVVDWSGLEEERSRLWHKQLHVFEMPFYYIEYGIAQLGAIGVWLNHKKDPRRAIDGYIAALKLGYTRTLPEIYATAGVRFDLGADHVAGLMEQVRNEMDRC